MNETSPKANLSSHLYRIALPIMGTSFVQIAYNITDVLAGATELAGLSCGGCGLRLPLDSRLLRTHQ